MEILVLQKAHIKVEEDFNASTSKQIRREKKSRDQEGANQRKEDTRFNLEGAIFRGFGNVGHFKIVVRLQRRCNHQHKQEVAAGALRRGEELIDLSRERLCQICLMSLSHIWQHAQLRSGKQVCCHLAHDCMLLQWRCASTLLEGGRRSTKIGVVLVGRRRA